MLLKKEPLRCGSPRPHTLRVGTNRVILRPGVHEFLSFMLRHFRCAIWSSMAPQNLKPLVGVMLREASTSESSFAFIYDQRHCFTAPNVYHPNKPGVTLFTKPFSNIHAPLDIFNTLLLDDTPEKAMYNPIGTCISPTPYDGSSDDDMLQTKLIPYLTALYHSPLCVTDFVLQNPFI